MLEADAEVAGAMRYVMVHAAAGRQANIQPFQECGLLDVVGGDSEPFAHVGKILRLRRHHFQQPRRTPHSPLHKADTGRIHHLTTRAFVAELLTTSLRAPQAVKVLSLKWDWCFDFDDVALDTYKVFAVDPRAEPFVVKLSPMAIVRVEAPSQEKEIC